MPRVFPEGHVSAAFVTVEQLRRQQDGTAGLEAGEAVMHTSRRDEDEKRFLELTVECQGDEDSAVAQMTGDHLVAQNVLFLVVHTHPLIEWICFYAALVGIGRHLRILRAGRILIEVSCRMLSTFVNIRGGRDVASAGRETACFCGVTLLQDRYQGYA